MTTGRWKLGLLLSLGTATLWGVLPIALKLLLEGMDPYTITWYRFVASGVVLAVYLGSRKRLPRLRPLKKTTLSLLLIAVLGLCGNYVLYLVGLDYVFPGTAQMVIQLAPMFLLLGGLFIFKETFRFQQWIGFVLLLVGLVLFFNNRVAELNEFSGRYFLGVLIIVIAAVFWAAYALAQKQLLSVFRSEQILLLLYGGSVVLLLPFTSPVQALALTSLQWFLLIFCCLNTLVAYGAFAEALAHWEASRVSAVLSITPLVTLLAMWIIGIYWPQINVTEPMNRLAFIGGGMVVVGSMATALGRGRKQLGERSVAAPLE